MDIVVTCITYIKDTAELKALSFPAFLLLYDYLSKSALLHVSVFL